MLKRSCLLEYLMNYAETLKTNHGKKAISADYFMLSLLKTLEAVDDWQIPPEIDREDAKLELAEVCDFLEQYDIRKGETSEAIAAAVTDPEYLYSVYAFMFDTMHLDAEAKAKQKGLDTVDTTIYLELIVENPTEAIRNHILGSADEGEESEYTDLLEEIDMLLEIAENDTYEDEDEVLDEDEQDHREEPKTEPAAEPSNPGLRNLTDMVQTTRRIQNTLLESVYGQDQAVNTFVSGYFQARLMASARKGNQKPQATFLFAGPPGVGKTFLAEKSAEALGLPYKRFDMSEYSDKEANLEFCGSDKVYKNGKAGNVTEFVAKNPHCVLLFDEIEKAHINIIYLFLQILDAGRLRDNFTDQEVSFSDAVIIFTTNVGKNLYEDPSVMNLSAVPRKKILKALATDVDPTTNAPLFPSAICSRFASGNVVMFNHLDAGNLYTIASRELQNNVKGFEEATGIRIQIGDRVPSAIMFSEGGKADARTVKGRANAFFYEELYEFFRLLASGEGAEAVERLKEIRVTVPFADASDEISAMFVNPEPSEVLVFADGRMADTCCEKLGGAVTCRVACSLDEAKEILFNHDISMVLCDVTCGVRDEGVPVLNAEDLRSEGRDFLGYVLSAYALPVYLLESREGEITREEFLSFAKLGVRGVLTAHTDAFTEQVVLKCEIAYRQGNMLKLARENKALSYKTAQTLSPDKSVATISLFDFHTSLITDTDDSKRVLDQVSRPNLRFEDVIGAEDAKQELKYFVEYLKNPVRYMRKGVRSPKGILLYGPPGTGKTLLAKAMAGESGVTFLRAEGNEFLKRFVGEGAQAVHDLFNAARKYAPAIVFIDEIDAIGKNRDTMGTMDTTSDVLTAFLTEMDGFNTDTSKPVFVLAATNYGVDAGKGKSLDAALLRRFDRRIYIDLPNKEERKRYLEMKMSRHSGVRLSGEQLDNIAIRSTGMSLSELESVFEMALRSAIRSESGIVGDAEFEEAFETFHSGEKKEWSADTLKRTARHEAGHALICWLSGEKPSYLTIVARGDHGGYMQHADSEGKGLYTKSELLSKIRTALGGRAAEMVYYGAEEGVSTGAGGDLQTATRIAEQMICCYGMDPTVGLAYIDAGTPSREVRERVNAMLREELDRAIRIIEANRGAVDALVDALMERNHLKENEIHGILQKNVKSRENA